MVMCGRVWSCVVVCLLVMPNTTRENSELIFDTENILKRQNPNRGLFHMIATMANDLNEALHFYREKQGMVPDFFLKMDSRQQSKVKLLV